MLRGFFSQDEEDDKGRNVGSRLEVSNERDSLHPIWARLYSRAGREIKTWTELNAVHLWDVSISEITKGKSKIVYKSVFVRVLKVKYDKEENILKVYELEPGAVIPP